jgi:hypothetical protein
MDQTTLVSRDVQSGAGLINALEVSGFEVVAAFWMYDSEAEDWRLVIASPDVRERGKAQSYRRVQSVIDRSAFLSGTLSLSRIALISDMEQGVDYLRSLSEGESVGTSLVPFGHTTVAGKVAEAGFAYRTESLRYQREVIAALQRIGPREATIQPFGGFSSWARSFPFEYQQISPQLGYRSSLPYGASHAQSNEPDLVLTSEAGTVLVELKSTKTRISPSVVDKLLAKESFEEYPLLLISNKDLSPAAKERVARAEGRLRWVRWTSSDDDKNLARAVNDLLSASK